MKRENENDKMKRPDSQQPMGSPRDPRSPKSWYEEYGNMRDNKQKPSTPPMRDISGKRRDVDPHAM